MRIPLGSVLPAGLPHSPQTPALLRDSGWLSPLREAPANLPAAPSSLPEADLRAWLAAGVFDGPVSRVGEAARPAVGVFDGRVLARSRSSEAPVVGSGVADGRVSSEAAGKVALATGLFDGRVGANRGKRTEPARCLACDEQAAVSPSSQEKRACLACDPAALASARGGIDGAIGSRRALAPARSDSLRALGVVDGSLPRRSASRAPSAEQLVALSQHPALQEPLPAGSVGRAATPEVPPLTLFSLDPEALQILSAEQVGVQDPFPWVLAGHGVPACDAIGLYGTDLGFSAELDGHTYFLFGDTWPTNQVPGLDPGPVPLKIEPGQDDDVLARIPVSKKPRPGNEHPSLEFFKTPIEVSKPSLPPLSALRTPAGAFATEQNLYTVFPEQEDASNPLSPTHCRVARYTREGTKFEGMGRRWDIGHPEHVLKDSETEEVLRWTPVSRQS